MASCDNATAKIPQNIVAVTSIAVPRNAVMAPNIMPAVRTDAVAMRVRIGIEWKIFMRAQPFPK